MAEPTKVVWLVRDLRHSFYWFTWMWNFVKLKLKKCCQSEWVHSFTASLISASITDQDSFFCSIILCYPYHHLSLPKTNEPLPSEQIGMHTSEPLYLHPPYSRYSLIRAFFVFKCRFTNIRIVKFNRLCIIVHNHISISHYLWLYMHV